MPSLPWRRRHAEISIDLVSDLKQKLEARFISQEGTQAFFIHPEYARSIMTRQRIRALIGIFPWYKESYLDELASQMTLIFCVLVSMGFSQWVNFKEMFYARGSDLNFPKISDANLPVTEDTIALFPEEDRPTFLRNQYIFVPVVIYEDTHQKYDQRCPLPFVRVDRIAARGAQGEVTKVFVASKFLNYARSSNTRIEVMALKSIAGRQRQNFDTERRALEGFKKSLVTHANIMQNFASFVHGSDFKILSPWADGGDLHQFLYHPYKAIEDYPSRSRLFSPHALLTEAYSLALALHYMHYEMQTRNGRHLRCAHLDLKPENILICFDDPRATMFDSPVGRWKIGDFGLAMIEESVHGSRIVPEEREAMMPGDVLREASFTPAQRGSGPFQPPEVRSVDDARVSTSRDVWSFGCILAMVLAFALGGPDEVANQRQRRRTADDWFYQRRNRTSRPNQHHSTADAQLKPDIRSWLERDVYRLAGDRPTGWIRRCSGLVLELLNCNSVERPSILRAVKELQTIVAMAETEANERWWNPNIAPDLGPDAGGPPHTETPPPPVIRRMDSLETMGDFVGVRSVSLPSSGPLSTRRSTATISYKADPSISFRMLKPPKCCQGAAIGSLNISAVMWSRTEIQIYDMAQISDDSEVWHTEPYGVIEIQDAAGSRPKQSVAVSKHAVCENVRVAGQFVAIVERYTRPSVSTQPLKQPSSLLEAS